MIYAIFDTNVYRVLTTDLEEASARKLFEQIKTAEQRLEIIPALSLVTVMELMAHLANPADPAFFHCKTALTIAGYHALRENKQLSYFPHPQLQLQNLIFGNYDEQMMSRFKIIMEIVNFINIGPADQYIQQFNDQITEVARMVAQHEQDFKTTMLSVVKGIDPSTTNWKVLQNDGPKRKRLLNYLNKHEQEVIDLLSIGYVDKSLKARSVNMTLQQRAFAALEVANYFKTAMTLHLSILKRMLITGFDMDHPKKNRENAIWDIYQLFTITNGTANGLEGIFVTADEWLHTVAKESGLEQKIIRKEVYFEKLGLSLP